MKKIIFIHTILICFVYLSIFMFGAGVEKVWAAWGSDTMGSYAIGTRDVLTQWNPADQQLAKFILDKRPDVKAAMLRRDPNNNEPNMVNDWAFGGGTGNWKARNPTGWPSEIKQAGTSGFPGTLIAYAKQLGWQDTTPVYTFTDGTTRTQAEMGAELWRAGWEGDAPPEASFGSSVAAILPEYLQTAGKKVATSPSPSPSPSTATTSPSPSTATTSPSPSTATTSPSPSTATTSTVSTSFYKVANNPTDLDNDTTAPWKVYTSDSNGQMDIPYSFPDDNPGQKFVWVQFKFSDETKSQKISKAINFVGADPNFSVSCTLDSSSGVIDFDMTGNNFGATKSTSKITINGTDAQIDDWKNDKVKGHFTPSGTIKNYTVAFNRADGATDSKSCTLGLAQISVGTKLFCRSANTTDVSNVTIGLVENRVGAKVAKETVVVGKDGIIKGLVSKLEEGKKYKMSIKAPKSLRKIVDFTAVSGTTGVANVNLSTGDIFPPDGGDGIINNVDRAELLRQWRLIPGSAAARSGDLNGDGLVNSFDWSCMVAGFGKLEDAELTSPVAAALCAADVKQCPDGSFVLRDAANECQFRACP